MTPKEYLSQLKRMRYSISRLTEDVIRMRARLESTTMKIQSERVKSSVFGDKFADAIAGMADKEIACSYLIDDYEVLGKKIEAQIRGLDNPVHAAVLEGVYINGWHLTRVAEAIHYSYQHTKRLHYAALEAFGRKYPDIIQQ